MHSSDIKMIVDFFRTAANLKRVRRQGWINNLSIDRPESVADHSYMMAVIGMVFSDLEGHDSVKICRMILLHDLAESRVGDHTPGQLDPDKKADLEDTAFSKITADLPEPIKSQYLQIWNEYRGNGSPEAKIVHQIDRLEMALQARIYRDDGHPQERLETFFKSATDRIDNPKLKELLGVILGERHV